MSTQWDGIYKVYEQGGDAWATLSEDIHPLFITFLSSTTFPKKCALDIGCGTGKYLSFLHHAGFAVDGIDTSETAVKMTKEAIPDAKVQVADMFTFAIPADRYDLILSVSTIHHGAKKAAAHIIDVIHAALSNGGSVFLTLPDLEQAERSHAFKEHEILEAGTYAPLGGPEKGLAHSFYTAEEIALLFTDFQNVTMELDSIGRWVISASK
jgi:2-polyprenyl-3-methyl-5-hydroxy-6-metoxy-1,4-benzoquinol methylase